MKSTTVKNIDEQIWRKAKALAVANGMTISEWLERIISERLDAAQHTKGNPNVRR